MTRLAWAYIFIVFLLGAVFAALAAIVSPLPYSVWLPFAGLTLLATLAQLFQVEVPGRPTFGIVAAVRPAPAVTSSSMIAVITGSTSAGTNVPHPTRTATGFGHVPGARLVFTALAVVVSITGM